MLMFKKTTVTGPTKYPRGELVSTGAPEASWYDGSELFPPCATVNSSEPSVRTAPGAVSMLVVVTCTSGAFLERPRKKAMAITIIDDLNDVVPAQAQRGIRPISYIESKVPHVQSSTGRIGWTALHRDVLLHGAREGFRYGLIDAMARASTKVSR